MHNYKNDHIATIIDVLLHDSNMDQTQFSFCKTDDQFQIMQEQLEKKGGFQEINLDSNKMGFKRERKRKESKRK